MWRRVVYWVSTDISEEHIASIFRVEEIISARTSKVAGGKQKVLSRVRRLYKTGYWIDNWIYWITHSYTITTITTDSHKWVTTPAESLHGPGPPADPTGSHWPSTNSSGLFSATHRQLTRNWNCDGCRRPSYIAREETTKKTPSPIPILLYDVITGTDPKENNSSSDCCVA
jgi:hypothetical protein